MCGTILSAQNLCQLYKCRLNVSVASIETSHLLKPIHKSIFNFYGDLEITVNRSDLDPSGTLILLINFTQCCQFNFENLVANQDYSKSSWWFSLLSSLVCLMLKCINTHRRIDMCITLGTGQSTFSKTSQLYFLCTLVSK